MACLDEACLEISFCCVQITRTSVQLGSVPVHFTSLNASPHQGIAQALGVSEAAERQVAMEQPSRARVIHISSESNLVNLNTQVEPSNGSHRFRNLIADNGRCLRCCERHHLLKCCLKRRFMAVCSSGAKT